MQCNSGLATKNTIQTDFKPKGKPSKHRKQQLQLARIITKERATRLEGSFGKEKEHYHLKKIKAKTKKTEMVSILQTLWKLADECIRYLYKKQLKFFNLKSLRILVFC